EHRQVTLLLQTHGFEGLIRVDSYLHACHLTVAQGPDRRVGPSLDLHATAATAPADFFHHHDPVAGVDELLGHDAKLLPDIANLVVQSRQPVDAAVNG